ncbi:hypothetical protein NDA18_002151 [Ustilago nuda]|nr:hypothetical protein NDA18_002151 [Ustilago nuda]
MSIPTLDEQFLPRLIAVFYAVFHPTEGPKVIYQVPEGSIIEDRTSPPTPIAGAPPPPSSGTFGGEPLFNFSALSEYLIPKAPLCGRLVTSIARGTVNIHPSRHSRPSTSRTPSVAPHHRDRSSSVRSGNSSRTSSRKPSHTTAATREQRTYKILGFPVLIEDAGKYQRNNFIFNLCFVFEGHSDVRAYEPVVRKCGRLLRGLEETQSFLSNPKSLPRMYGIIEQLFEDLSSYCESFIALPDAPYTSYLDQKKGGASRMNSPEGGKLVNPVMGPEDFITLGASFASLRGEKERNAINERLKARQASKGGLGGGNAENGARSRSTSGSSDGGGGGGRVLSPLTTISPAMMVRSNSASGASGPGSEGPHSPSSALSPTAMEAEGRRPSFARFSTIAALTDDGGAYPSEESRDTAMGIVSSRRQSELTRELSAAETLGNVLNNGAYDSINTGGTRRSSRASTAHGIDPESESLEHLTESIVSLRTIDAALSNSVNALRTLPTDPTARTNLVEKREPPHGLGRTVRDAINLKLFPVYPNPAPINDWDVPVALLDLLSRVDGNWDLTLRRILPFIDGVNHVKRIAQLADADLGLTSACLEHLMYYGCIIVVDIFQYFNMYTVRPAMAKMADDEGLGRECRLYVTRAGYGMASWPELLRLYSLLRAGTTLADWVEDNAVDEKGIDVRRFVSFGVIQGFLRRVHRYPIYLGDAIGLGGGAAGSSGMSTTVVNSPAIKQREHSGSREPRDRRPRELSGMSGAYSAFQRITRDGSVDSPGVGTRTPTRRGASEARSSMVATGSGSNFTDSVQVSPTKRTRQRQKYRHPTTTAVDVAAIAFQVDRPAGSSSGVNHPRSPRKRASAIGLTTAMPSTANLGGSASNSGIGIGVGTGAASSIYLGSTTQAIPPDYADTDEDDLASTQRSDWRRWPGASILSAAGGVGGASSGWSGKGKIMSGISGVQGTRSGLSGAASSGGQGSSKHGGATQGGESSGFGVGVAGWGNDGDESGWVGAASGGGVVAVGALDREAIESGDLGAVRILYQ